MPFLTLMEPTYRERPFTEAGWVFNLPLAGYRMLADWGRYHKSLFSLRRTDVIHWFPEVAEVLSGLCVAGRTVIDGELCVLDAAGRNDALRLKDRALVRGYRAGCTPVVFCMLDVLMHAGRDVRWMPWHERRQVLASLADAGGDGVVDGGIHGLMLQRTIPVEGERLYRQAMAQDRRVIHARRIGSPYVGGQSRDWLSIAVDAEPARQRRLGRS